MMKFCANPHELAASAGVVGDASSPIKSAGIFLEDKPGRLSGAGEPGGLGWSRSEAAAVSKSPPGPLERFWGMDFWESHLLLPAKGLVPVYLVIPHTPPE